MADGPMIAVLEAARRQLRDCYWWRRLADADAPWDETTAEAHIHFDGLPPPSPGPDHSRAELVAARPFALLWLDNSGGMRMRSVTAGSCCALISGRVIMQIEVTVPTALAGDPTELAEWINRRIGQICHTGDANEPGLFELAGRVSYLPIHTITVNGYQRADAKAAKQVGDALVTELQVEFGLED